MTAHDFTSSDYRDRMFHPAYAGRPCGGIGWQRPQPQPPAPMPWRRAVVYGAIGFCATWALLDWILAPAAHWLAGLLP